MSSQEKQMEVCETCGAFLIVGDAQSRVDDHLQGKQHVGYARIKAAVDEMKVSERYILCSRTDFTDVLEKVLKVSPYSHRFCYKG